MIGRAFLRIPAVVTSIELEDKTLYKIKTKSVPGIYLWYFFILSTATGGLIPVGGNDMLGGTLILQVVQW